MYLNYIFKIWMCLGLVSCNMKSQKNSGLLKDISEDIKISHPTLLNKQNIFILAGNGCPACNRRYLQFIMDEFINDPNTVIYSTASGISFDISSLLSDTIKNLVDGNAQILSKHHLDNGSYYLKTTNKSIDTIIAIRANDLENTLNYIGSIQ